VVDATDITIDIDVIGRYRGLFSESAGDEIGALIFVEVRGSMELILVGIKSNRVGRTSRFIKTQEKASAIMFLYLSMYWIVHIKLLIVF